MDVGLLSAVLVAGWVVAKDVGMVAAAMLAGWTLLVFAVAVFLKAIMQGLVDLVA